MEFDWLDMIMLRNFLYAIIGVSVGVFSSILTYKLINRTTSFDIPKELEKGNLAVGVVVGGIFIMIGLIVGFVGHFIFSICDIVLSALSPGKSRTRRI
jgi:uncharacterized membrane protein YjfL (UPF0719 family)